MTQDQMRLWNDLVVVPQLFSPHTCNVSLDNILGGKRRTRSVTETQFSSPVKTPRTTTPRTPRTPRSKSTAPDGQKFFSYCKQDHPSTFNISFISCRYNNKIFGLKKINFKYDKTIDLVIPSIVTEKNYFDSFFCLNITFIVCLWRVSSGAYDLIKLKYCLVNCI